nr:hypothetical protein [Streptomyces chromofuscus]
MRGRLDGAEHEDPDPLPYRTYAVRVGGPLDGLLLDITDWRTEDVDDGVALFTELGRWPGDRALCERRPRRTSHAWSSCSTPCMSTGEDVVVPLRRAT